MKLRRLSSFLAGDLVLCSTLSFFLSFFPFLFLFLLCSLCRKYGISVLNFLYDFFYMPSVPKREASMSNVTLPLHSFATDVCIRCIDGGWGGVGGLSQGEQSRGCLQPVVTQPVWGLDWLALNFLSAPSVS